MLDSRELPTSRQVIDYLSFNDWTMQGEGPAGSLWTKNNISIGVPNNEDEAVIENAVRQISKSKRQSRSAVVAEIRYLSIDVSRFRAASHLDGIDSIPLGTAESIIHNVRHAIRSAGTTAFRLQGDLKGHYSSFGVGIMNSARMAHTEYGSFVIPILVTLPSPEHRTSNTHSLFSEVVPEPAERRVVRTLAQSLQAIQEVLIRPAVEPDLDALHSAVQLGVSRELCVAMKNILQQPAVGDLEATFQWGQSYIAPRNAPTLVNIESGGQEILELAARKLKTNKIEPARTLTGNIIALRHVGEEKFGYVTISTARNGRPCEVAVQLPYSQYVRALHWHEERRVLIIEGEISGGRGKRLQIDRPTRCEPIEQLFRISRRLLPNIAVPTSIAPSPSAPPALPPASKDRSGADIIPDQTDEDDDA